MSLIHIYTGGGRLLPYTIDGDTNITTGHETVTNSAYSLNVNITKENWESLSLIHIYKNKGQADKGLRYSRASLVGKYQGAKLCILKPRGKPVLLCYRNRAFKYRRGYISVSYTHLRGDSADCGKSVRAYISPDKYIVDQCIVIL